MHARKQKKNAAPRLINMSKAMISPNRSITRRLGVIFTSSAATVFAKGTSGVTASPYWANLAAAYTEARVLEIRLHVAGSTPSAGGSGVNVFGTDRSGAQTTGTVTSQAGVWELQAAKAFNAFSTGTQISCYTARALDLEDQLFSPVGAMPNNFSIFGITAGGVTCLLEFLVEFKGAL